MISRRLALALMAGMAATILATLSIWQDKQRHTELNTKLAGIMPVDTAAKPISCSDIAKNKPLVLLALGQSNAGNHGILDNGRKALVTMVAEGKCFLATDPLPGGTGSGGSVWQRLPTLLTQMGEARPVVLSVLAVDATTMDDWTRPDSPVRHRLASQLASMRHLGLPPHFILWQQGEADARMGTSATDYAEGLDKLAAILDEAGANAPVLLARSTICRTEPSEEIHRAIETQISANRRWHGGPDTDTLTGDELRNGGCHFTALGLDRAARMWATALTSEAVSEAFK